MFSPIFAILSSRTKLAEKKVLTMHDHRTIFSCIERRDAAGAEAAMLNHLVDAEMKLLKASSTMSRKWDARFGAQDRPVKRSEAGEPSIRLRGRAKSGSGVKAAAR